MRKRSPCLPQVGNEQSGLLAVTDIFRQLRAFYCLLQGVDMFGIDIESESGTM